MLCHDIVTSHAGQRGLTTVDESSASGTRSSDSKRMAFLFAVNVPEDLVTLVMASLCGLGQTGEATRFYERWNAVSTSSGSSKCEDIYRWALKENQNQHMEKHSHGWRTLAVQLDDVLEMALNASTPARPLSPEDAHLISCLAALCLSCSIAEAQPNIGFYLGKWLEICLAPQPRATDPALFSKGQCVIPVTDTYLASAIAVHRATGKSEAALQLVESLFYPRFAGNRGEWILSCNEVMRLYCATGRTPQATGLFNDLLKSTKNQDAFRILAQELAIQGEWRRLSDLYKLALANDALSEELSYLMMKAVVAIESEGKFRILKQLLNEITAGTDLSPTSWLESNYWEVKKAAGPALSRGLMLWTDSTTSHWDELDFAFKELNDRVSKSFVPHDEILWTIIDQATAFDEERFPYKKEGLHHVPRTYADWLSTVRLVVREAQNTGLLNDSGFVRNVATAFIRLGKGQECLEFVVGRMNSGFPVTKEVLRVVAKVPDDGEVAGLAADVRMMIQSNNTSY